MALNLREKCDLSKKREFFYGAKVNSEIKDAYIGLCYLEPGEEGRKAGPGRGHEEIIYLQEGQIEFESKNEKVVLNEGDVYYISDGLKIRLKNLTEKRAYFIISGGHTKHHSH